MSRFHGQGALPRTALAVLLSVVPVLAPSQAQAAEPPAELVERFVEAFTYTEHTGREIKALSPEEVDQLLTGQGVGLALAGELNGYPGPKHVLELAAELDLSEDQRAAVSGVYDPMIREAIDLGGKIVEAERRLDALFAGAEATPEALRAASTTSPPSRPPSATPTSTPTSRPRLSSPKPR